MTNSHRSMDSDMILPLTQRKIVDWAAAFGSDGEALWADTTSLASRFWAMSEDQDRQVAWHHLVMSVGNFKRQTPIHIGECMATVPEVSAAPPEEVVVPGGSRLARDEAKSWRVLTAVRGLGVATATTLLSALWPGTHVIIDRFAWAAAVGLRASQGVSSRLRGPEDRKPLPDITWSDYDEYLPWVHATAHAAEVEPRAVERTLYQLPREVGKAESRSWRDYGVLLRNISPPE